MNHPERGLYLRADGTWLHDGTPVEHARLAALLHRSITRMGGTYVVTTGRDTLPFAFEDTPLRVLMARPEHQGVRVLMSHGREEELRPESLEVDGDDSWRCLSAQDMPARFTRSAQLALVELLESGPDGSFALRAGGKRYELRRVRARTGSG